MRVVPFERKKGTSEKDQVKVGDNTSRIQVQYKYNTSTIQNSGSKKD